MTIDPEGVNNLQDTSPTPSSGEIEIVSQFPSDIPLPPEAKEYLTPALYNDMRFFLAKDNGAITGLAICELPPDKNERPEFTYRYVFPTYRRKGIGKRLRDTMYDWLTEQNYTSVGSGINGILKIQSDGSIVPNLRELSEGGWKSYLSMTKSSSQHKVSHHVTSVSIGQGGNLDLSIQTDLDTKEESLFPNDPKELMKLLYDKGILPQELKLVDLLKLANEKGAIICSEGKIFSIIEWARLLKSRR